MRECPEPASVMRKRMTSTPAAASNHALGLRSREPGIDQIDQELDLEAMCEHDRLGAAIKTAREQFER
jgi:hypothetical protein